jgi:hypothetical protein
MPAAGVSLEGEHRLTTVSVSQQGLRWRLINLGIGLGAFFLTCIGLRAVLPFPMIDGGVSQKLRFFAAHKDEFDTLFIGSSRVYFQISPAIFDRTMRESGNPTHSFNFGIGGMYLPESAYVLEQLLNTRPRNLKWIFIEYEELQTNWSPENQTSRRALYWADWKRTSLLLRKLTHAGTDAVWLPNVKKLCEANTYKQVIFHTAQFEKNFTNVARAPDILNFLARRDVDRWDANYLGAVGDGYVSRPGRMSASQAAAYESALDVAMRAKSTTVISGYTIEAYRQCAKKIRAIGATPIFLVPPSLKQLNVAYQGNAQLPGIVVAFNDPRAYPNLYASSARRDREHLTKSGAEEFTRIVALNFLQLVRQAKSSD